MKINFTKTIQEVNTLISFISSYELNKIIRQDNSFIIADAVIVKHFQEIFNGLEYRTIIIKEEHDAKNFDIFEYVCNELIKLNAGKNSHLYGIGGGTITDLTGFVASVYLRGIKVSFVPTTLLSMVDASIGGKNAINIGTIKNIVGSIYQPANIYLNPVFLTTLSRNTIFAGFAEIMKIGLLFDIQLLNDCFLYLDNNDTTKLNAIIIKSINHKMRIVAEDTYDNNTRIFLNFGHTIGHMIELDYELSHGNAVAIGMVYESQIAVLLGLIDISIYNEIHRIITKYFRFKITDFAADFNLIKSANKIFLDKKLFGNVLKIPVIKEIGRAKLEEVNIKDFVSCFINININSNSLSNKIIE
jgi:3-dehydroquinate synthase